MMENLLYLSQEWGREVKKQLEENLTPDKMNNLTSSMNNVYTNCPNGSDEKYFFVGFTDGKVDRVEVGEGKGPQAEFTITGDYEIFSKISRAELGSQKALMGGKLKLRGNMVKALKLASLCDRINKVVAAIPTQFE
jgi:putative sterol carrier protein